MLVSFRPHRLQYQVTTEGHEDENGDYQEGESHFEGNIPCRYEPNGGEAKVYVFDDGTTSVYRYIVYLDNDCKSFNYNDVVKLLDKDGNTIIIAKVLGFHRGQLNARLWV